MYTTKLHMSIYEIVKNAGYDRTPAEAIDQIDQLLAKLSPREGEWNLSTPAPDVNWNSGNPAPDVNWNSADYLAEIPVHIVKDAEKGWGVMVVLWFRRPRDLAHYLRIILEDIDSDIDPETGSGRGGSVDVTPDDYSGGHS